MKAPPLLASVEGKATPLDECVWVLTAPCGCICGAHVTDLGGRQITNAEHAFWLLSDDVADRDAGFTAALMRTDTFRAAVTPCPHVPQWGVAS